MSLKDGLISWWSMDEDPAQGFITDQLGNNTLISFNCRAVPGRIGGGISVGFDPANNSILYADGTSRMLSFRRRAFTFALWVNFNDTAHGITSPRCLISKGPVTFPGSVEYELALNNVGPPIAPVDSAWLNWYRGFCCGPETVFGFNTLRPAEHVWHFIVAGWDADKGQLFMRVNNGTEERGQPTAYNLSSLSNLAFGSRTDQSQSFDGALDNVALWGRALSPVEQTQLWNSGFGLTFQQVSSTVVCKRVICCPNITQTSTPFIPQTPTAPAETEEPTVAAILDESGPAIMEEGDTGAAILEQR